MLKQTLIQKMLVICSVLLSAKQNNVDTVSILFSLNNVLVFWRQHYLSTVSSESTIIGKHRTQMVVNRAEENFAQGFFFFSKSCAYFDYNDSEETLMSKKLTDALSIT